MNLLEILLRKAQANELAHFYILETAMEADEAAMELMDFGHQFIKRYYREVEKQNHPLNSLMDHPDVLVLTGVEEKKDYTVQDAAVLEKFFNWKSIQGKKKFVIIPEAHRITNTLANKWLKILEEPPVDTTIFLLNPRRIKLLPTIESRSLSIRLPRRSLDRDKAPFQELMKEVSKMGLHEFLEKYSKGDRSLSFWFEEILEWETEQLNQMNDKAQLEKTLKLIEEMETYHQLTATKWTFLYNHLKEHVLPRLNH